MNEIWKDIEGFEGLYQVSSFGNVRSVTRYKKILKPFIDKDGYRHVLLKHNGLEKHYRICRLVATAFIPKETGKEIVNHIDADRKNDNVNNLEWCTPKENVLHSVKLGRYKGINAKAVKQIKDNICIKTWESMTEAEKALKIPAANISRCAAGKRKTAGGYVWEIA